MVAAVAASIALLGAVAAALLLSVRSAEERSLRASVDAAWAAVEAALRWRSVAAGAVRDALDAHGLELLWTRAATATGAVRSAATKSQASAASRTLSGEIRGAVCAALDDPATASDPAFAYAVRALEAAEDRLACAMVAYDRCVREFNKVAATALGRAASRWTGLKVVPSAAAAGDTALMAVAHKVTEVTAGCKP